MNRCLATISLSALTVGMLVAGCQKAADQQSSPDANSSPSVAETANNAVKKALEPKPLVVPAETVIAVVLDQTISSKTSKPGDRFSATVESPVEVEGKIAIPKGARAEGVVNDAKAAGRFKGGAALSLTLTSVTVNGKDYEIRTSAAMRSSKGKGKRTAVMVGGGAAGGAGIGALAGGHHAGCGNAARFHTYAARTYQTEVAGGLPGPAKQFFHGRGLSAHIGSLDQNLAIHFEGAKKSE